MGSVSVVIRGVKERKHFMGFSVVSVILFALISVSDFLSNK